jgi:hypothetical protein
MTRWSPLLMVTLCHCNNSLHLRRVQLQLQNLPQLRLLRQTRPLNQLQSQHHYLTHCQALNQVQILNQAQHQDLLLSLRQWPLISITNISIQRLRNLSVSLTTPTMIQLLWHQVQRQYSTYCLSQTLKKRNQPGPILQMRLMLMTRPTKTTIDY